MIEHLNLTHKLLVTIVKKGVASKVVKATKEAGAEGGTILYGRGTGINEKKKFLGITVEPEKEVILTLVPKNKLDLILSAVEKAGKLDKPGNGIGFIVDVKKVAGIVHLLNFKNEKTNIGG
ncbi:nitrogen regulatory protein P-II [Halalkalibacter wakoensis JCM 9140]|uniref:Nitrogen regulatory protein P-II n=1 Tax=Halalkalibacter wakoensis JCM 9140 TaxID=1236970 RepID=W4Q2Z7_9BACI|nr:P-II family nitrogen regulator [Halalkalibacter wakoensis]GAE26330.1 nitrogen regulatory protein P-II [Halalkalibacter wakoensis JCM 9140]